MRIEQPRIRPLAVEKFNDEQRGIFSHQINTGDVANIFRTLANHPKLAKRWMVFANHILAKSSLPPRDREILILRIGWLCQAEYEWGQHVVIGKAAGLTDDEIGAIKDGADASNWSEHEALLIRAADELKADAFVCDETWAGLARAFNDEQMMDVVFTVGQYNLVSMALNSFGVQLDDNISGF